MPWNNLHYRKILLQCQESNAGPLEQKATTLPLSQATGKNINVGHVLCSDPLAFLLRLSKTQKISARKTSDEGCATSHRQK